MFLLDKIRLSLRNALLRTTLLTFPAPDTAICDDISFFGNRSRSERITFPEDRLYAKIKVFDLGVFYLENDPDLSGITRINIGEIGLLCKDRVDLIFLLRSGGRLRLCGQPDHFFETGIGEYLHLSVLKKLFAKVFSSAVKK